MEEPRAVAANQDGDQQLDGEEQEDFGPPIVDASPPATGSTYNPDRHREFTRIGLSAGILLLLIAVIIIPLIEVVVLHSKWSQIQGVVGATVPGVIGIAGTILGFYFGREGRR